MKKYLAIVITLVLVSTAWSDERNILGSETLRDWLKDGPVTVVDIRHDEDYALKHVKGSIRAGVISADTEDEQKNLDRLIPALMASKNNIVIIRQGGKLGRTRSYGVYDYFLSKGIPEERLYILEEGIEGWPDEDMIEQPDRPQS